MERVKAGEDFGELAKKYSHDPRGASGGLWPEWDPDSLAQPYDVLGKKAQEMKPGEVAGPIEAIDHIFIMKLEKKQEKGYRPLTEVQDEVEEQIMADRRREASDQLNEEIKQLAAAGNTDRFVDYCLQEPVPPGPRAGSGPVVPWKSSPRHRPGGFPPHRGDDRAARGPVRQPRLHRRRAGVRPPNRNTVEKYAGRFAAKEAILKLLGTGWRGKIAWTDIEVTNNDAGRPEVTLSGEVKVIADRMGIGQISISITHTANFAIASAVALARIA